MHMSMPFEAVLRDTSVLLTEGAIVERLKNEDHVTLDDHINHAGLIYDAQDNLATLYKQYIEIARGYHIPMMLMSSSG
jgi:chromosome condensin MukBEF MukE localization factor